MSQCEFAGTPGRSALKLPPAWEQFRKMALEVRCEETRYGAFRLTREQYPDEPEKAKLLLDEATFQLYEKRYQRELKRKQKRGKRR